MNPFKVAKWIWANNSIEVDDYAEFVSDFVSTSGKVSIKIAADSTYAIYVNSNLVKFMTGSDLANLKYFDEFVIDCNKGTNHLRILVWHYGFDSAVYVNNKHGVIFEVSDENNIVCASSTEILSRVMNEFKNGYCKRITVQLGLSFYFDNTVKRNDFTKSVLTNIEVDYIPRLINEIELLDRIDTSIIKKEKSIIIDMGKEVAGFIDLDIDSSEEQEVLVAFGEHIADGGVRRFIQERDFSVEYKFKKGSNTIFNPLRRIAGRYLEIFFEHEIQIKYAGIRPVFYKNNVIPQDFNDDLLNRIYNTCVHTLRLCMHEHYEDCPWREQALYALDSRNQMLCGYYAFEGHEYQRHNLVLLSKGLMEDLGLLSLTTPCGVNNFGIPFFSLIYIKQVEEYIKYSGDETILGEVAPCMERIMNTFITRMDENHLIPYFEKPFWNFYEWTDESDNASDITSDLPRENKYELIINCAFVYVAEIYNKLLNKNIDTSITKSQIIDKFYDTKQCQFVLNNKTKTSSQLGNAFACLIGLGSNELLDNVVYNKSLIPASLSTRCFVYDALLTNKEKYKEFIIQDIKDRYISMLIDGATTFYETEDGHEAFGGAGSMCHGWSAIPIYYLNILLK